MEKTLKVSIIVPVHNSEKSLSRCVESILSQDYKNIECILIENGSTDNSRLLCSRYAESYSNIIYKSKIENGVSAARNSGLAIATGDIIGFCDADDFLETNAVALIVKQFLENLNIVAVFCGFNVGIRDLTNNIVKVCKGIKDQTISASKALCLMLTNDSVMGSVWNKYYRADILKNKLFDTELSFCEDMHFNAIVLDSIQSTCRVKVINTPLYCYMENPQSATHNSAILFDENNELKYIIALKKIARDCKLNKTARNLLKMRIACFSIDFFDPKSIDYFKRKNLFYELKLNYKYLITNLLINNWKWNLKRAFKGAKILMLERK